MEPLVQEPVRALLAHYQATLGARPDICARLEAAGIASQVVRARCGLGLVDRTAGRTLLSGRPERLIAAWRAEWRAAGAIRATGRERFLGCIVVPLGSPDRARGPWAGLRLCDIEAPASGSPRHDPPPSTVFVPQPWNGAGELVCCGDPFDALVLRTAGVPRVAAVLGQPHAPLLQGLHALFALPTVRRVRLALPGTATGMEWTRVLLDVAAETGVPIDVWTLPAGCRVRDIRRLHGSELLARFLAIGPTALPKASMRGDDRRTAPSFPPPWTRVPGTLASGLTAHLQDLRARARPEDAVRRRSQELQRFWAVCTRLGVHEMQDLTPSVVEAVQLTFVSESHGADARLTLGAARRLLAGVRIFLAWALRTGRLANDAAAGLAPLPRIANPPPVVLTADEVERALCAVRAHRIGGLRDRAMLEVLYSTGIRRGELVGLDVGDLDPARGVLRVRRGKGGTSRLVPIGARAIQWVTRYIETERLRRLRTATESALFVSRRGTRLRCKTVTARMHACLRAAGITKPGSCHIFRHTVATLMHEQGADIRDLQALLGHALLTSTQLYTRVSMQRLKDVHARTHPGERFGVSPGPDEDDVAD